MAKAKKKRKKLKKYQIEIDLLDPKSIRKGLKRIIEKKIAMPWKEDGSVPPCYVRLAAPNSEQIAIVDPHLGGYANPHEAADQHGWGWKTHLRHRGGGGGTGWRGICKTAEEAKVAADEWLKGHGFTLLEE